MDKIAQQLEEEGVATKKGRKLWRRSFLKAMLENETYLGTKYYNKVRTIREYANPIYGIALDEALRASCERGMGLRPGPANHPAGAVRARAET